MRENPEAYKLEFELEDEKFEPFCCCLCPCLPSKVKKSEGGLAWRRKNSSKGRQRPPAGPRPTLLLPPMRYGSVAENATSPPVVTQRVQQNAEQHLPGRFLTLDPTPTLPEPSAPSPGHLFYNSEDHSDVTFLVGPEGWRFPAHSFVLARMQNTLDALLKAAGPIVDAGVVVERGDMAAPPLVLKLPGMQPEVFEQILRYIYTGHVPLSTVDSSLRLLHASQPYHLPQLTTHCLNHLSSNLTPSSALLVLRHLLCPQGVCPQQGSPPVPTCEELGDNERNELVFKCFLVVDRHADEVLRGDSFETLELELLLEIVKRDTLEVSSEAVVFEALMRWACRACKRQRMELTAENKCSVLGKALFLVRYLTMTQEEFLCGPVSQGVLTREDKEMFLSRLGGSTSPVPLPEKWSGWKVAEKRRKRLQVAEQDTGNAELVVSPSNSIQPVNSTKCKKKSMSKKLLNGVGDLVICVIQLLD